MDKKYDSLSTYLNLAKKTINKFAPSFLSKEMLSSSDAVSEVATAIMFADWRFDPNRKGKTGQQKTLYSYRNQCAIWAIKTYITNKYKPSSKKKNTFSLEYDFNNDESGTLADTIADSKLIDPLEEIIDREKKECISELIEGLLNSNMLSVKQKDQIKLYYLEGYTLSKIGQKYGVSREAVRQNIKRAIGTIKQYI